ncbi:OprD family outer membrane porin [Seleniivibrio sp.]|uniref:OprD family outer membrane porin n=1 Tax=Seleniivibrio sp. TaxID=2898801 RepID=UPI0025E96889|nr:OprD family outer membrane porin [Seleniivibrio sp.]MCD8554590.1 OprD family porin [Seleniivibrio sp.]
MQKFITLKLFLCLVFLTYYSDANAATTLQEAFSQGTIRGELRANFFSRDFEDSNKKDREDFAAGTSLYYHTAPMYGLSAGAAFASANDIDSDRDKATYGMLAADHENVARLQEFYIQGDWFKTTLKYGAQELETPFMNTHDIRLLPRTYKGLSIKNNSIDNMKLSAYYITESAGWTDDDFVTLSQAVAAESGGASSIPDEKAMVILGAEYNIPTDIVKSNVQGWYYTMTDVFNQTYLKTSVSKNLNNVTIYTTPSVLWQKSQGDELNGNLSTYQYGLNAGVKALGFNLTGYYAKTGDDAILAPWGDEKIVILQLYHSERAEEDTYALKLNYDFSKIGIKGLSSYIFYANFDTPDSGANASSDASETDLSATYSFHGALEGVSIRARYAMVNIKDGKDINDLRFYVSFKFGSKSK